MKTFPPTRSRYFLMMPPRPLYFLFPFPAHQNGTSADFLLGPVRSHCHAAQRPPHLHWDIPRPVTDHVPRRPPREECRPAPVRVRRRGDRLRLHLPLVELHDAALPGVPAGARGRGHRPVVQRSHPLRLRPPRRRQQGHRVGDRDYRVRGRAVPGRTRRDDLRDSDTDTLMLRAVSMPTKAVSKFAVANVLDFIGSLNIERCVLRIDGEPAIKAARRTAPAWAR